MAIIIDPERSSMQVDAAGTVERASVLGGDGRIVDNQIPAADPDVAAAVAAGRDQRAVLYLNGSLLGSLDRRIGEPEPTGSGHRGEVHGTVLGLDDIGRALTALRACDCEGAADQREG